MNSTVILACFFGGILPAVLWLEFWLREATHREPRRLIIATFHLGMLMTLVAGVLETPVMNFFTDFDVNDPSSPTLYLVLVFVFIAFVEEAVKFIAAWIGGLRSRFCDDAVDPSLYMITSALGFSAAENILFLFTSLEKGEIGATFVKTLGNRFVGATLLHTIASSMIGIALGFAFYKSERAKKWAGAIGLFLAVALHTAFNTLIIKLSDSSQALWVFSATWIGLLVVILVLENIKNAKRITRTS